MIFKGRKINFQFKKKKISNVNLTHCSDKVESGLRFITTWRIFIRFIRKIFQEIT